MQVGEHDGRFWWRAGGAPVAAVAPARVAWPAAAALEFRPTLVPDARQLTPSHDLKPRRRRWPGMATVGFACACLAVFGAGLVSSDGTIALPRDFEQTSRYLGLALEQVSVGGHRQSSDSAIFDALQLDNARSLLAFDVLAAKARLEQLPWVDQASVSRILPGGLDVTVVERVPVAVWKRPQRDGVTHVLIDRTGRSLAATLPNAMPSLPLIEGIDADQAFPSLLQLQQFTVMASSMARIERVSQRRWTLYLKSGQKVLLPSAGEAAALDLLHGLTSSGLDPKLAELDMRLPGRLSVRYDEARRMSRMADDVAIAELAGSRREAKAP